MGPVTTVRTTHGYRVIASLDPTEALQLASASSDPLDLLVTDITLPHMNGKELYQRLQPVYPAMRVLFMSGYTQNVIDHQHVLEDGIHFLEKPFTMHNLLRRVREALGTPDRLSESATGITSGSANDHSEE